MERHFRRFAQQLFDFVRIFHAGQLHLDAVGTLPHNRRFARSQLIDTAADDFDGLIDRGRFHFQQSLFRKADGQHVAVFRNIQIAFVDFANQFFGFGDLFVIDDFDRQRIIFDRQIRIAHVLFAQSDSSGIHDRAQLILDHLIQVDLQQQLRTALQVQTQRHRLPPFRQFFLLRLGNKVGDGEKHADRRDYSD